MYNYKNPFAEFNSNVMSSEQISMLFAAPFDFFDISALDISSDNSSILFIGGRGTGKTMLLRQFSYNVQRVSLASEHTYLEKVKKDKYVGVYFRVDNPLLRSLESIATYSNNDTKFAENIFTHYFELVVFKEYVEIIKTFIAESGLNKTDQKYHEIINDLLNLLQPQCSFCNNIKDIDELLKFVINEINYIWKFQSDKAIDIDNTVKFTPSCGLILQGRLTNEILKTKIFSNFGLDKFTLLILIDEFENFSEIQQKVLNTAMRFTKEYGARLRIGMRPNGFKTFATLDDDDFVKEGRDYRKVEFNFAFVKKGVSPYPKLVKMIAQKRLELVEQFSGCDIVDILGKDEDLENEAKKIVNGKKKHFTEYIKLIQKNGVHESLKIGDLDFCKDDNPLYEMECLLLLLRGKSIDFVKKAFEDYKNKITSEEQKKFYNDYDNKYKLSFVFILCSIYKNEDKQYYGFTDYCQLSSGIVGAFLELCRRAFEKAYFEDRDELFNGHISSNIQTKAAYEYATAELEMTHRIAKYGGDLKLFVDNIGNAFGEIHKDMQIRYPETNIFPINSELSKYNRTLIDTASMWSLIIKKPNLQDSKAQGRKQNIYYINRIFAPAFKISYRTRGGINPISVDDSYFSNKFNPKSVWKISKDIEEVEQISLFYGLDIDGGSNEI